MEEIWKDIEGCEGKYQVSNLGRVRSIDHKAIRPHPCNKVPGVYKYKGRILKCKIKKLSRYYYVGLSNVYGKKQRDMLVHRLVAEAFIPNPDNLPFVNHKNEIKTDNRVDNLEWCTHSYNMNYGSRAERYTKTTGTKVEQIDSNGNVVAYHESIRAAARSVCRSDISIIACLQGKTKTSAGYRWRYAERKQ